MPIQQERQNVEDSVFGYGDQPNRRVTSYADDRGGARIPLFEPESSVVRRIATDEEYAFAVSNIKPSGASMSKYAGIPAWLSPQQRLYGFRLVNAGISPQSDERFNLFISQGGQ